MPLFLKHSWPPMLSICLCIDWSWKEPLSTIGRVLNIGSSEWFIVAGCIFVLFFVFPFSLFGYVIFSYVTETKTSQECLFTEQYLVHFLVLYGCVNFHSTTKSGQKKGCLNVMYQKKKEKRLIKVCLRLYTCNVSLPWQYVT